MEGILALSSEVRPRAEQLAMTGHRGSAADGWDALYHRMYPKLFAYSRRRTASDHAADDVVAETMARAVAGWDRYVAGPSGVDGWLFGICRNVVREQWRRDARDARWSEDRRTTDEPDAGPLDSLLASEERSRVAAAFARLSPDERDVLELRVTAGLDARQVASVLGTKPGAVRMAQSRALARLRTFMEEVT